MQQPLIIRHLGVTEFEAISLAMQTFTAARTGSTPDEVWLTEHPPVYTLGLNRKNVRQPMRDDITVINTDRGGKITFHGPGQVIIYVLLDLTRRKLNIRSLVSLLENTVIELLADYDVIATSQKEAPGVYVQLKDAGIAKIASLGLRIKNNCCYHGLSLNVEMDLTPFEAIDPCGYAGLKVIKTKDLGITANTQTLGELLVQKLTAKLEHLHESLGS
ncbi:MAG: lipoyl(octanoyl) transferase LipB [Methylotenera sp.]|nr:lipoyl(octanoyl) transferase LipB [Methylotenera sp.]MDO9233946.1 lipoyl(octanoyl) transferase LipB [Methylotenera sp.]MDO9388876.1 lipoyl(octanoyl) transferase LipB [Methylotenera sp.]MDP1755449.1 lipoyl(octanoyl) transferase LipB [Methylotenera sp.]MDP2102681.1 lipoyl(octanoyl) transferase LipB [Methylotenera sp.]